LSNVFSFTNGEDNEKVFSLFINGEDDTVELLVANDNEEPM